MRDLERAKEILVSEDCTCVLCKEGNILTSHERGVKPLVLWLDEKKDLRSCSAADKVVGRATAFLYVLLGARAVYARVISRPALEVLISHGIETEYDELTENIINRKKDGICPFEETVLDISEPDTAYLAIREKMRQMNIEI